MIYGDHANPPGRRQTNPVVNAERALVNQAPGNLGPGADHRAMNAEAAGGECREMREGAAGMRMPLAANDAKRCAEHGMQDVPRGWPFAPYGFSKLGQMCNVNLMRDDDDFICLNTVNSRRLFEASLKQTPVTKWTPGRGIVASQ